MEHTKGKIKHKNCGVIRSEERDKHIATCISYCSTNPNFSTDAEANAEELVRRWNAYEEGGLVEQIAEAKHRLEKIIAYCKTTDETYEIAEDLTKLVLSKLLVEGESSENPNLQDAFDDTEDES